MNNSRVLITLFINCILWIVISEINHQLAPLGVNLQLDVLFIIFAGLYFRLIHGAIYCAAIGLFVNATIPLPFGTMLLSYTTMWFIIVWARNRIRRENPSHIRLLALFLQLCWITGISVLLTGDLLKNYAFIFRIVTDYCISVFILMIVVYPWCEFQRKLLLSLGWDLNSEINRP